MSKYNEHIQRCNDYSQSSPDNMVKTITFVLATVQQQLEQAQAIVSSMQLHGAQSKYAFGSKAKGLDFIVEHKEGLYYAAMAYRNSPEGLLRMFIQVPGLGLAKAGFTAQLFGGVVGCIDTHNIKLYNVPLQTLRYPVKGTNQLQLKYINRYVSLCSSLGGSEFLWVAWCEYVASIRPKNWANGLAVSEYHCEVIGC